jgi:hypothetical protein
MGIDVVRAGLADPTGDGDTIDLRSDGVDQGADMTVWVTVAEAAEKAGVSTSAVRQWYRSGRLPTQRAEGERGAFLVPLDAVMALAGMADDTGDPVGAELIDLNATYWSEETRAAREEAAAAREQAATATEATATATAEAARLRQELDATTEQLTFLRGQLAEASETERALRMELQHAVAEVARLNGEIGEMQQELDEADDEVEALEAAKAELESRQTAMAEELAELRAISGRAGSITDNSWLDLQTPAYQSPVRPQLRLEKALDTSEPAPAERPAPLPAGGGLANLLAQTVPDGAPAATTLDEDLAPFDGPEAELDDDEAEEVEEAPAPPPFPGFGKSEDDLLPEPADKKRGRRR